MNSQQENNKILVLGASGQVGFATLKALASKKIYATAGVRDPSKENLKELDSKYINIVKADMGQNQQELASLLQNYNSVYLVTPKDNRRVEITNNAIRAAKQANVGFVLIVSIPESRNQNILFGRQFSQIEDDAKASGLKYELIKLPMFTDNFLLSASTIVSQNTFYGPINGSAKYAFVTVDDAGIAAAEILSNPNLHTNKTHWITSDFASNDELAQAFSKVLKREIKYVDATREGYRKALEPFVEEWVLSGVLELNDYIQQGNSEMSVTTDTFFQLTGKKSESNEEWIAKHSAIFAKQ